MLDQCGLEIPVLYQYINFLLGQEIVTKEELEEVYGEEDLSALLCSKIKKSFTNNNEKGIY